MPNDRLARAVANRHLGPENPAVGEAKIEIQRWVECRPVSTKVRDRSFDAALGHVIDLPNGLWMIDYGFCVHCDPVYRRNLSFKDRYNLILSCPFNERSDHAIGLRKLFADSVGFCHIASPRERETWSTKVWSRSERHLRLVEQLIYYGHINPDMELK